MTFGNRIGRYRRKLGMTQEALARKLGVTNQAVSKWESDQCCPDIGLLPRIADIFGITMDELFGREVPSLLPVPVSEPWTEEPPESEAAEEAEPVYEQESSRQEDARYSWKDSFWGNLFHKTIRDFDHRMKDFDEKLRREFGDFGSQSGTGREVPVPEDVELPWEDDSTLRVALFIGKKMVAGHPARERIEFCFEGQALNIHSECDVSCGDAMGNVWAGGDVSCDSVGGSVRAGGDVSCDGISGDVQAGGDVSCDGVGGNVTADGDVSCETVYGDVKAGGDVSCEGIMGNVNVGGDVDCGDVQGSVRAGGDVDCSHVEGSVSAGGDVSIG